MWIWENVSGYAEGIKFFAAVLEYLAGLKNRINAEQIRQTLVRVGLDPADGRCHRKYSLGMKQRLAIAQAVMESPDVLMLDEPTNALDEEGIGIIRKLILEEKERGALILLTSHNREDILVSPVFCCEEHTNIAVPVTGESTYVPYREVSGNEFFGTSQKTIAEWEALKEEMLALYGL